jgi:hypothetical protein
VVVVPPLAAHLQSETEIRGERPFAQVLPVFRAKLLRLGLPAAGNHVYTITMDQERLALTRGENSTVIVWFLDIDHLAI